MKLQAWIDDCGERGHLAAFISEETLGQRQPAMQLFPTRDEARQWIDDEAVALASKCSGFLIDETAENIHPAWSLGSRRLQVPELLRGRELLSRATARTRRRVDQPGLGGD